MSTYTCLHYHIVFSTKDRMPTIHNTWRDRLWSFMGGIVREANCFAHAIGGVEDHAHCLVSIHQTVAVADLVREVKSLSSGWAHQTIEKCELWWQPGYAVFTVSHSMLPKVQEYVQNQAAHHANKSYEEELRQLLIRHEVEFDPNYL